MHLYRRCLLPPSKYICTRHCTPVGVGKKRAQNKTPFAKALFSHREHSVFAQGVLRRTRTFFILTTAGHATRRKCVVLKIKRALVFKASHFHFRTESRRTRLIISPTIPPYRRTVAQACGRPRSVLCWLVVYSMWHSSYDMLT